MIRINKSVLNFCFSFFLLALGSCTKNFKEYNTNKDALSDKQMSADYQNLGEPLKLAQYNAINMTGWIYQLVQNLNGDIYSGYMMSPTPFRNNVNNTTYFMVDGWNFYMWDEGYSNIMKPIQNVLEATTAPEYASYRAWAKVLRVEGMHRVSDMYGPIIYTKYGQSNSDGSVSFDSQKDAYYAFFTDLDSAINVFTDLVQNDAPATFSKFDLVYGGSFAKWLKFANTLRLRLAMRISKADPVKAKAEGEAALANPGGLLATNDDNTIVDLGNNIYPVMEIKSWNDIRIGAPLACYLNGYNDARISHYMYKATDPAVAGQYIGIRQGIDIDAKGRYRGYSEITDFPNKMQLMTAAEAWFLKAEASLKGWAGAGDAQTNYETGISTSFAQYGEDASSYITNNTNKPQQYIDPKAITPGQNDVLTGSPYLSTITIKWDNAASADQKLERIMTQKWIAMFPDGQEAWSEFRRTGYPKLFPVILNKSGGNISTSAFIQRVNFPSSEKEINPAGVTAAVGLLGGADNGGTKLWWAQ